MPRSNLEPSSWDFLVQVFQILGKDLRIEWRSREILYTMIFFSVLVIVIFSFAFAGEKLPRHQIAGGILWVVVLFAGALGLGRMFDREREDDTYQALLMCPANQTAIYLGKLLGVFLYICIVETVVLPLLMLFFNLQVYSLSHLLGLLLLGALGFSAVGSLFAASLMQSRSRDVLLGILIFPIVTPVIVAGAKGTAALMLGPAAVAGALVWLKLILVFDVIFVTISLWAFGPLIRGE